MDNDTARRLAKHPRWQWLPGMLARKDPAHGGSDHTCDIARVVDVDRGVEIMWCTMEGDLHCGCYRGCDGAPHWLPGLALPDLDDASTEHLLWGLVCEACATDPDRWSVERHADGCAYGCTYVVERCEADGSSRRTGGMQIADALLTLWERVDAAEADAALAAAP